MLGVHLTGPGMPRWHLISGCIREAFTDEISNWISGLRKLLCSLLCHGALTQFVEGLNRTTGRGRKNVALSYAWGREDVTNECKERTSWSVQEMSYSCSHQRPKVQPWTRNGHGQVSDREKTSCRVWGRNIYLQEELPKLVSPGRQASWGAPPYTEYKAKGTWNGKNGTSRIPSVRGTWRK